MSTSPSASVGISFTTQPHIVAVAGSNRVATGAGVDLVIVRAGANCVVTVATEDGTFAAGDVPLPAVGDRMLLLANGTMDGRVVIELPDDLGERRAAVWSFVAFALGALSVLERSVVSVSVSVSV